MITPHSLADWKAVPQTNELAKTLRLIEAHLDDVLTGRRIAAFLFGGSGMGKNHLVEEALLRHKVEAVRGNPATYRDTLNAFHAATSSAKPRPIVFDEAELIFTTAKNLDIMKVATDAGVHATRHWPDYKIASFDEDGKKVMVNTGVSLKAPLIVMTNLNLDQLDHAKKGARASAEALASSRVLPVDRRAKRTPLAG